MSLTFMLTTVLINVKKQLQNTILSLKQLKYSGLLQNTVQHPKYFSQTIHIIRINE